MSGAVSLSLCIRLPTNNPGPRGSLPDSPVVGVDEEQAEGCGDRLQLAEEEE